MSPSHTTGACSPSEESRRKSAILTISDSRLFYAARHMLDSLERFWPDYPDVLFYYCSLEKEQLDELISRPRVQPVPLKLEPDLIGPAPYRHPQDSADLYYGRLLAWSEKFSDYDKVLYLDADTLVLGSLDELFEKDFYATLNQGDIGLFRENSPRLRELLAEDGLSEPPVRYANAGVFLVSRHWRTNQHLQSLISILRRYRRHLLAADQAILNIWMLKNGLAPDTDTRFNYQVPRRIHEPAGRRDLKASRILHFNGMTNQQRKTAMKLASRLLALPCAGKSLFSVTFRMQCLISPLVAAIFSKIQRLAAIKPGN